MLVIRETRFYFVPIVVRTIDIIELLLSEEAPLSTREVSESVGVPVTTTYRILRTLLQRGYVMQDLQGRFRAAAKAETGFRAANRSSGKDVSDEMRDVEELPREQMIAMLELVAMHLRNRRGLERHSQSRANDRRSTGRQEVR